MAAAHSGAKSSLCRGSPPRLHLELWPHRSLSRGGFRLVMKIAAAGLALPVIATMGSPVSLMLLPFSGLTWLALWWFIRRNYHDAGLTETLLLWDDLIVVERREANGALRKWQANPYWVEACIHADARIENYLTLKGNGREIELGAFLSPKERLDLFQDIQAALSRRR